ncbi:MAG: aminomethyl-transferring glycine dehydrogenase subunit GcvPB, partial [Planctomycetota bacterium]
MMPQPLIFEKSICGTRGVTLPPLDVPSRPIDEVIPQHLLRKKPLMLPELPEPEITRHFTLLSQENVGVDTHFYPLGSCTMKYNPKVNETIAGLEGFVEAHPYLPEEAAQGALALMWQLQECLAEIAGMKAVSLQPAAGAHGELTGIMLIRAYHIDHGDEKRRKILIPDSAHGTNPASCALCGFVPVQLKSDERGNVDIGDLRDKCDDETAGMMLTIPSTLGLFDERLPEIVEVLHRRGALLYMDGANMNAILSRVRPGDVGVDVMHFNLHKTFSTPHGMGGPGSGPVAVCEKLEPYLPVPTVAKDGQRYFLDYARPKSIGRVRSFYGNFGVFVKALCYIMALGAEGLKRVADISVLNANYLQERLKKTYHLKYDRRCMHEFVISGVRQKREYGVRTLDIAKRLLDLGFHPPTIYFPLIVEEALMVEPTETESKRTLDAFAEALERIAREAVETPDVVKSAP